MSIIKIFLFILILSVTIADGRALRKRRQTTSSSLGQAVNNYLSYGYNTIRDNVAPAVSSAVDRLSQNWDKYQQGFSQGVAQIGQGFNQGVNQVNQNWDRYKQNFNQGVNQFGQGWNQFTQNVNPQYPYNTNNAYNQYGYNSQQYAYPMNNNYNYPPNMYQNYNGRQGYPYQANNYYNGFRPAQQNIPYYRSNAGGQWYQNVGGQPRSNVPIASNPVMYANQRAASRRK